MNDTLRGLYEHTLTRMEYLCIYPYTGIYPIYPIYKRCCCCLHLKVLGALEKVFSPVLELIFCILVTGIRIIIQSDESNCPL